MKKYFIFSTALLALACSPKEVARVDHQGPAEEVKYAEDARDVSQLAQTVQSFDLAAAETQVDTAKDAKTLLRLLQDENGLALAAHPRVVQNRNVSLFKTKKMLSVLNAAIVRLYTLDPKALANSSLLKRYIDLAFEGCDAELRNCTAGNYEYLYSDSRSYQVLLLDAELLSQKIYASKKKINGTMVCEQECLQHVTDYTRRLRLASDLMRRGSKNITSVSDFNSMFFRHISDINIAYTNLAADDVRRNEMKRLCGIFENEIRQYSQPTHPKFLNFLASMNPWTISRREVSGFACGSEDLLRYAGQSLMYQKNGDITPELKTAIYQSQVQNDVLGNSFKKQVEDMVAHNGLILKLADIDVQKLQLVNLNQEGGDNAFYDELFFIVDRLYRGHLNIDEAGQILSQVPTNKRKQFVEKMSIYLKIQILRMVIETNNTMGDFYTKKDEDTSNMLRRATDWSYSISTKWKNEIEKVDNIGNMVDRYLKILNPNDPDLQAAKDLRDSIRRNIKYVAVYPNMMLLTYFMADQQAKLEVNTWFGKISIDAGYIIDSLLNGRLGPWFKFGNDMVGLNKIEIIYSFYFALSTGTFETYGAKKDENGASVVDRKMFFDKVLRQFLNGPKNSLQTNLEQYQKAFTNKYDNFMDICEHESRNSSNYSVPVMLADLNNFVFTGNGSSGISAAGQKAYSDLQSPARILKELQEIPSGSAGSPLLMRLTYVRTMVEILEMNLDQINLPQDEKNEILTKIHAEIQSTQKLIVKYYNEAFKRHREVSDCLNHMAHMESERQLALLRAEKAHLENVYNVLVQIESAPEEMQPSLRADWNAKLGFNEADLDKLIEDGYKYSKYSLYLRFTRQLANMRPKTIVEMPTDITKHENIYAVWQPIKIRNPKGEIVTQEDFVKSGLKWLSGTDTSSFVSWRELNGKISFRKDKISSLVEMYRMGRFLHEPGSPDDLSVSKKDLIQLREIVREVQALARQIHISPEEMEFFRLMGIQRKTEQAEIDNVFINFKTNERMGFFDFMYEQMTDMKSFFEEGTNFFQTNESTGLFVFQPPLKVQEIMFRNYRPLVMKNEAITLQFHNQIQKLSKTNNDDNGDTGDMLKNYAITYAILNGRPAVYQAPDWVLSVKTKKFINGLNNFHTESTANPRSGYFRQTVEEFVKRKKEKQ